MQDLGDLDAGLCVSRVQVGVTRSDDAIHVEAKGANPTGVQLDGKAWQWLSCGESMDVPLGVIAQLALHKKRPRSTLVDIKSWHPPWSCTKTALIQLVDEMHDLAEQTEVSKSIASGTDRRSKVHMLAKLFTVLESQPAPQPAPQPASQTAPQTAPQTAQQTELPESGVAAGLQMIVPQAALEEEEEEEG